MQFAIFGNPSASKAKLAERNLFELIHSMGDTICIESDYYDYLTNDLGWNIHCNSVFKDDQFVADSIITIGGDGTFLTTASLVGHLDIPILGVNCGHLGYLAEVQASNVEQVLDLLISNQYTIEQRRMLEVSCMQEGKIASPYALNEVGILKSGLSSMITVEVTINGEFLHNYKADGLLIATPTGSTAFNLSVGGPLLDPQVHAIILSPVATHSLNVRPLVVLDNSKIDIRVYSRNGNFLLSVDGRSQVLKQDIHLHIERSQRTIKLVRIDGQTFMQSLKDKLYWGK